MGQRLTGGAGKARILEDTGFAHGLDHVLVINERGADDIGVRRDLILGRGGHEGPLFGARGFVEFFGQAFQRLIALVKVSGYRVAIFDFGKANDICIQAIDGRDDLALLVL